MVQREVKETASPVVDCVVLWAGGRMRTWCSKEA